MMDQYFKLLNNEIYTLELTDYPDREFLTVMKVNGMGKKNQK